jgi:hypothetical protein
MYSLLRACVCILAPYLGGMQIPSLMRQAALPNLSTYTIGRNFSNAPKILPTQHDFTNIGIRTISGTDTIFIKKQLTLYTLFHFSHQHMF